MTSSDRPRTRKPVCQHQSDLRDAVPNALRDSKDVRLERSNKGQIHCRTGGPNICQAWLSVVGVGGSCRCNWNGGCSCSTNLLQYIPTRNTTSISLMNIGWVVAVYTEESTSPRRPVEALVGAPSMGGSINDTC
jgi:hypothetical protein